MTIEEFLQELGYTPENCLKGRTYTILCPVHDEKTPSFKIWKDTGNYKCFGCGIAGTVHTLPKLLGKDYVIQTNDPSYIKREATLDTIANKLKELRGIIPSDYKLVDLEEYRKLNAEMIKDFGLFTSSNYPHRICIPLFYKFKPYGVIARSMIDEEPKYLTDLVSGKLIPFPLDKIDTSLPLFITEGIFDMFAMRRAGFHNTVTVFGTSTFKSALKYLPKVNKYYIVFDGDKAGKSGAEKFSVALFKKFGDISVKIIELPDQSDPDSLSTEKLQKIIKRSMQ
jgi:DNA primase